MITMRNASHQQNLVLCHNRRYAQARTQQPQGRNQQSADKHAQKKGKKKHATPPTLHTFVCSECIARSFLPWTSLAP